MQSSKKTGLSIAIIIILAVLATALFADKKEADDTTVVSPEAATSEPTTAPTPTKNPPKQPVSPDSSQPSDTKKTVYKNGTYVATGTYMSPGGLDKLPVTLTITNDVVTDATVVSGAGDNTSERYQQKFISGYKQYVIGKNIDTINLTKVSGASLTPIGFNDALVQIKAKAKA